MSYRYESIKAKIEYNQGRGLDYAKLDNNTYSRLEKEKIIIKLHDSDIIELLPDSIMLDSCGFKTSTTKDRLNKALSPCKMSIYQDKFIWYIAAWGDYGNKNIYQDNMTIKFNPDNYEVLKIDGLGNMDDIKRINQLKRRIDKYSDKFIKALFNNEVEKPSNGDCFYCLMREVNSSIPIGELNNDNSHIESHMEEDYFVPSLLMRSIEIFSVSLMAKSILYSLWYESDNDKLAWGEDITKDQLKSSLKRYIRRQFNIA